MSLPLQTDCPLAAAPSTMKEPAVPTPPGSGAVAQELPQDSLLLPAWLSAPTL